MTAFIQVLPNPNSAPVAAPAKLSSDPVPNPRQAAPYLGGSFGSIFGARPIAPVAPTANNLHEKYFDIKRFLAGF